MFRCGVLHGRFDLLEVVDHDRVARRDAAPLFDFGR